MLTAVAPTIRKRKVRATRARIAEAALELFVSQGFAETTIDQIATAAGVGRRTIFRHFATKEAILFDHLVVGREAALKLLQERPPAEPVLVSLHAVLRELCVQGYDRRVLAQIRDVLAMNPGLAGAELSSDIRAFEQNIMAKLQSRLGERSSLLEIRALTLMAASWTEAAAGIYLKESNRSLVDCFDEIVMVCLQSAASDLAPSLGASPTSDKRRTRTPA